MDFVAMSLKNRVLDQNKGRELSWGMEDDMAALDGSRSTHSFEELKRLLACASAELESTRQAAKAQGELHGARVRHLEELLKNARRERDEAREQCMQLQGRLKSTSQSAVSGLSQELSSRALSGLQSLESVVSMSDPSRAILNEVHRNLQGQTQESQLRTLSGLQPLESVASMPEPSLTTITEVHRKPQGQQPQLELQKPLEYVSSMPEPTRDTLSEFHRKMQEQQQQLGLQQLGIQQHHQHHLDLKHQHANHSQLDLRPTLISPHLEFRSAQQQHQLEELRQHLEIQQKDDIDMVIDESRQVTDLSQTELDNGSDAKSTTWSELPSGTHLDIHSPNDPRLILDDPDHMHMELTQALPSPNIDHPPCLQDLHMQLQQQQRQDKDDMHIRLHHQQESEQLLSQMQQGSTGDRCNPHLQDEKTLRCQLTQHEGGLSAISAGIQGTSVMSVMQQSSWPCSLMGLSSPPPSNGCQNGLSEQLLQSSCLKGGSAVASLLTPLERFGDSGSNPLLIPRPLHLPEPPEADPQVMLNSLPERGKLLQAVMQAGPLLQALLLAGPLPQWRHPPPTLDSEEIPRVSMGVGTGIIPPVDQAIGLMAGHGSSLEHVMRLSAPLESSSAQNGFLH